MLNCRPQRIVGFFTLLTTLYLAYVIFNQSHSKRHLHRQTDRKTKLKWKLLEEHQRKNLQTSYPYYSEESQLNPGSEMSKDKQSQKPYVTSATAAPTHSPNATWVQSEVSGEKHFLDNATSHIYPPTVPIKCKFDSTMSEVLTMDPIKFLPNYKNPCWEEPIPASATSMYKNNGFLYYSASYRNFFKKLRAIYKSQKSVSGTRIRCLPYFFISGQPKCGSTDLYNKLTSHPHIATPPTKESHWWGKNRYGWCLNYSRPIPFDDYLDLYDHASIEIQSVTENSPKLRHDYHPVITGDASVSTLWSNDDWWSNPENCGLTEPLYTNAHHIHHLLPNARIIVILRKPTDRLYSDYLYFRQYKSTTNFHEVVETAIKSLHECFETMGIRSCAYNASIAHESRLRIRIGLYHVFLQEWMSVFPKDQILVLRLEDYAAKPLGTMKKVHKFLGLRELSEKEHEEVLNQPKSNTRRVRDKRLGSMMNATRELLDKFYRPFNIKLARLMNNPAFLWED